MVPPALALPILWGPEDRSQPGPCSGPRSPHHSLHCQPHNNPTAFASLKMHKKDSQNEGNSFCSALGVQRKLYKTDISNQI